MLENIIFIWIILNKIRVLFFKFMLGLDYGFLYLCLFECIFMKIYIIKSVNCNNFIFFIRIYLFNMMWVLVKVLFIIIFD